MANPTGIQGPRQKQFRDALRMSVAEVMDDFPKLRKIADALVSKALSGDVPAIKEIAERLDGKVPQAVTGDDEYDPIKHIHEIRRVLVRSDDKDS